jgi:hypothetical protein
MPAPILPALGKALKGLKAVKGAFAVGSNKEARNIVLGCTGTAVVVAILPLLMIITMLTMPFAALRYFFGGRDYEQVVQFRGEHGFDQYLDVNDEAYRTGAGVDYSGVVFADGTPGVVYFNQLDARWKDEPYGQTGTIGTSGCGPTALAMAVSSLTDRFIDPVEMSRWSFENGYRAEGNGSFLTLIPNGARHFGLTVEEATRSDGQKIVDALASGKLIIAIMSKGHFTSGGHFIVLRGVTEDGMILVADPASLSRSEREWDLSIILDEARRDAGAPFWILSY